MGKYLFHFEADQSKIPIDPKERGAAWARFMVMVRQDFEKGIMKDFGMFVGQNSGYFVCEGSEIDVMKMNQQYVPFIMYKVYPVASEDQHNELIRSLIG